MQPRISQICENTHTIHKNTTAHCGFIHNSWTVLSLFFILKTHFALLHLQFHFKVSTLDLGLLVAQRCCICNHISKLRKVKQKESKTLAANLTVGGWDTNKIKCYTKDNNMIIKSWRGEEPAHKKRYLHHFSKDEWCKTGSLSDNTFSTSTSAFSSPRAA